MPSLKDLRVRIKSVKSTQKITSAMKMVAAAKLRRAQEQAESARPYADRMARMLESLAAAYEGRPDAPPLLAGTGKNNVHLVIVATSDRGLCGGFNSGVVREARRLLRELLAEGKEVKILCLGRKGRDQMKRDFGARIVATVEDIGKPRLTFAAAEAIQKRLLAMFEAGEFDAATVVYSRFKSAISQIVTRQRLVPLPPPAPEEDETLRRAQVARAVYEYEPSEEELLAQLSSSAGDMIDRLTLFYNRTRQAYITKELIEIISGAEAL